MERKNSFWEPVLESNPSDRFICTYGGPLAQHLQINRSVVDKFLNIASLDGRVLLTESKRHRPRIAPDINPDGSVTAKGILKWGEKPALEEKKDNVYFQVEPDQEGWVISLNGRAIHDDLMEKTKKGSREVCQGTVEKLDYYLRVGLKESLLKDKLTTAKDPYIKGRMLAPLIIFLPNSVLVPNIILARPFYSHLPIYWSIGCYMFISFLANWAWRKEHYMDKKDKDPEIFLDNDGGRMWFNPFRRTVEKGWEVLAPPIEADRVLAAYAYLDYQKLTRNPLFRSAKF